MCLIDSDFDTEDEEFGDDIEELISGSKTTGGKFSDGTTNPFKVSSAGVGIEFGLEKGFKGFGIETDSFEPKITTFCDNDSDKEDQEPTSPTSSSSDDAI